MHTVPIAVASRCLEGNLKQKILTAREINVDGIQFDARNEIRPGDFSETGRRQFLHLLAEVSLKVASLSFPTRRPLCELEQLDARIDAIRKAMLFASQLKTKVITVRLSTLPEDRESALWKTTIAVLNDLAAYGNHIGTILSLTPSHQTLTTITELLAKVDQGPIGINLDPAQLILSDRNPVEVIRQLHSDISHVVVRDAVRDENLGGGIEVAVGRGEVVWDELFATLEEAAYTGWMTVDRTQGNDILGDATRAVQFVRHLTPG